MKADIQKLQICVMYSSHNNPSSLLSPILNTVSSFATNIGRTILLTAHTSLNSYIPGTHKLNILAYAVCISDILAPICLFKSTSYTSSRDLSSLIGWDSVMTSINLKQEQNESLMGIKVFMRGDVWGLRYQMKF